MRPQGCRGRGLTAEPELVPSPVADRPFGIPFGQFHPGSATCGRFSTCGPGPAPRADPHCRGLRRQRLTGGLAMMGRRLKLLATAGRGFGSGRGSGAAAAAGFASGAGSGFRRGCGGERRLAGLSGRAAASGACHCGSTGPRQWTLPITALRVTPPSSLAIWLADCPSAHMRFSVSTRHRSRTWFAFPAPTNPGALRSGD